MKKSHFILNVLLIMSVCLCLNSCISINRNIKLNKDGSGEEVLSITFLKEFYSMMSMMTGFMDSTRKETFLDSLYNDQVFIDKTQGKYENMDGIKLIDIGSQTNFDSSKSFTISYTFDNLSKLGSLLEEAVDDDDKIKTPAVVTLDKSGDEYVFSYLYENTESEDLDGEDSLAVQMKASVIKMFENGSVNFEIEFPYEIISSNATSSNGNKLTWNYPMSEIIMQNKMKLEAVMK